MKKKRYPFTSKFNDRHGKARWRFRRKNYPTHYFAAPYGTKEFEREYAACLEGEPIKVGADRAKPGSVSDVIARYYADNAFQGLRDATQVVYRGVLERFRAEVGQFPIRRFDAGRIALLMNNMRHKPHAAARLRKLLAQLLILARREGIVPYSFDPVKDTKPPKTEGDGYHRWTEEELTKFEEKNPLGTKPRLAFALLLYAAQRSGDVRFMTPATIAGGRIRLDQSKTSSGVDVPVIPPLQEALDAGPLGSEYLLETKDADAFTEKGFYGLVKKACVKAGIPHCAPHGLRKSAARRCREAGCTDEQGMAITGHKTVREYRRYAGNTPLPEIADAAMAKVMANLSKKVANAPTEDIEKVTV